MQNIEGLQKLLKYRFHKVSLLKMALVHRSYGHENNLKDNQRLEFLGDAVLDLVIAELIYRKFPKQQEGFLSKYRSSLVNQKSLAALARDFNLGFYLLLSGGKRQQESRDQDSLLSDLLEALIGAIFLDGGYEEAKKLIRRWFYPLIVDKDLGDVHTNYKGCLQELSQCLLGVVPKYKIVVESGEEHQKIFVAQVSTGQKYKAQGHGVNKKEAQKNAAHKLWTKLKSLKLEENS